MMGPLDMVSVESGSQVVMMVSGALRVSERSRAE